MRGRSITTTTTNQSRSSLTYGMYRRWGRWSSTTLRSGPRDKQCHYDSWLGNLLRNVHSRYSYPLRTHSQPNSVVSIYSQLRDGKSNTRVIRHFNSSTFISPLFVIRIWSSKWGFHLETVPNKQIQPEQRNLNTAITIPYIKRLLKSKNVEESNYSCYMEARSRISLRIINPKSIYTQRIVRVVLGWSNNNRITFISNWSSKIRKPWITKIGNIGELNPFSKKQPKNSIINSSPSNRRKR